MSTSTPDQATSSAPPKAGRGSGPTLRHVAQRAGIGVGTASRVFSGNGYVSQQTREAVLNAARELDYSLHPGARALATGKTQVIALWARGIFSPFFSSIVGPVQKQTARAHYRLLIDDIGLHNKSDGIHPGQWTVDGILAMSSVQEVAKYLAAPQSAQRPIVSMGYFCHGKTDSVALDMEPAVREAMAHLLENERRDIVYLVSQGVLNEDVRTRIYGASMEAAGLPARTEVVPNVLHQDGRRTVYAHMTQWLRQNPLPQAFFCWNDDIAIATYRALREFGARVPDDVALVGCDGIEDTEYLETPLSTIITPFDQMCSTAWDLLLRRIDDPTLPIERLRLPLHFEARASSVSAP